MTFRPAADPTLPVLVEALAVVRFLGKPGNSSVLPVPAEECVSVASRLILVTLNSLRSATEAGLIDVEANLKSSIGSPVSRAVWAGL